MTITDADREADRETDRETAHKPKGLDVMAERIAFEAWWSWWCPDQHAPPATSHIFDAWLASARHREAAEKAAAKAMQEGDSYAAWQQKRGMLADKVDWAILEYDEYMKGDGK